VKLQVNCESLVGKRGRIIAGAARRLLRQGLVSGLGTDAHAPDDSPPLMSPVRRAVERAAGRGSFDRLTWEEPLHIIGRGMAGAQASALP
jgi:tyrosine-protein phosphatase YwqE